MTLANPRTSPVAARATSRPARKSDLVGDLFALRIMACGNCNGMASVNAARVYGFRPWSNGSGQTMQVEMASPMYSLLTVSDIQDPHSCHLHNVAEDGNMTLVCEIVLDAWNFTCLSCVRSRRSSI